MAASAAPAPRPGRALGVALLCLLGLALVWVVAELVPAARVRDAALLQQFTALSGPHVDPLARRAIHLLDPGVMIFWGLALVLFAGALLIASAVYVPLWAGRTSVSRRQALNAHKYLVVERLVLMSAVIAANAPAPAALGLLAAFAELAFDQGFIQTCHRVAI